jgi:hypothetical protein
VQISELWIPVGFQNHQKPIGKLVKSAVKPFVYSNQLRFLLKKIDRFSKPSRTGFAVNRENQEVFTGFVIHGPDGVLPSTSVMLII